MSTIAIIGATSGIGRRVAEDFASYGWRVAVAGRRVEALKEFCQVHPDSVYEAIDVTTPEAVAKFYKLIERANGVDVVLFCSGIGKQNPELNTADEVRTLDTNVVGFARIVTAAYKYFRDTANNAPGRIAVVTSVAGTRGIGVAAAYSASKRFQQTYIDALEQLAHKQEVNVRFTDIRPGFIRTDLLNADASYPLEMTLDYAAPLIEAAILKGKRVATVDWRWRLLTSVWRRLPRVLWANMDVDLHTGD